MVAVNPVVGVEQADAVILFGRGEQRAEAARGVAVVGMGPVELEVAYWRVVDPGLRKSAIIRWSQGTDWARTLSMQRRRSASPSL